MNKITIFSKEPDFINEEGTKWWFDKSSTTYAQNPDLFGITLDIVCYFVEDKQGFRTRVLIQNGEIIDESTSVEGIGVIIDTLKLVKRLEENKESKNTV